MCFKAQTSQLTFDTSTLQLQPFTHSMLFWMHLTGSGQGSLDIELEEGFAVSISLQGSISIEFGDFLLIPTAIIPSLREWYLVKLSVANSTQYDILMSKSNGDAIADDRFLKGSSSISSPSLSSLTIQAVGISGASICINQLSLYNFAIPNEASIQISSMPFTKKVNIQPVFSLRFDSKYPQLLEEASHMTVQFEQSALSLQALSQDARGDSLLQCDLANAFYSINNDQCQNQVTCSDSNSEECSANSYAVLCSNLYYSSIGQCVTECPSSSYRVQKFCFSFFFVGEVDFTLSVDAENVLTIAFTSPIINSEYAQILKQLELSVTGPRNDYNATIISHTPHINENGKVESIVSPLLIQNTIRLKEDVIIEVSILSDSERIYRSTHLKPQDPPQFKNTLKLYDSVLNLAEYGAAFLFSFFTFSALFSISSFQPLWTALYPCQLLTYTVLVDSPLPANVQRVLDFLEISQGYFSWFDHLPNLLRNRNLLSYQNLEKQQALSRNFEMNGFASGSFFLLYENKILILQFGLLLIAAVIIFTWTLDQFKNCTWLTTRLMRCFDLDFWLRFYLFLLLELVMISLIASTSIFKEIKEHIIDLVLLGVSSLLISIVTLLLITRLCHINRRLKDKHDKWRGRVMTESIKVEGRRLKCKAAWPFLFLIQRFLFAVVLVQFYNSPSISGLIIGAILFLISIYLIVAKPFKSKIQNLLEFINRLLVFAVVGLTVYLVQSGYELTEQASFQMGTIMVCVVLLFLLLNVIILFMIACSRLFKQCKRNKKPEVRRKIAALEMEETVDFQEMENGASTVNRLDRSTDELREEFTEMKPGKIETIPKRKEGNKIKAKPGGTVKRNKQFKKVKEEAGKFELKQEEKKEEVPPPPKKKEKKQKAKRKGSKGNKKEIPELEDELVEEAEGGGKGGKKK